MRRGAWSVALLVTLAVSGLAQAGSTLAPVRGEFDHQLDAALEGRLSTGPSTVLSSLAQDNQAPKVEAFHLQALSAEATIVRMSSSVALTTEPLPPLATTLASDDDIEYSDEEVEHKSYRDLFVLPRTTSVLWNVVAYGQPGEPFQVLLPEGTYALGQTGEDPAIVRAEVPRTQAFQEAVGTVIEGSEHALELRSAALESSFRGDFYVLLYGASFDFQTPSGSDRVDTGRYQATYHVKGGLAPEPRDVNAFVLLQVRGGVLQLASTDAPLTLHARSVHLDGRATFEAPTGTFDWQDQTEDAEGVSRTIEGQFQILPRGPAYTREDGARYGPLVIEGYALVPTATAGLPWAAIGVAGGALALGAGIRWVPGLRRLAFAAVAGFSLVQKDEALEHRARSQLYEYVRTNPGAPLSVAQVHLGLGWGTVEYHVGVLERLGLLVTKRAGGKRLLFATGQGRVVDPHAWSLLRNPSVRQLASTLFAPGRAATQTEVAQALDCSPQYAGRLLRKLAASGLVQPSAEAARRAFASTDLFHDLARRTGILSTPAAEPQVLVATA